MDKFLLAYNPNTDAKSGLFIVHCLHPMAIIEVSKSPVMKGLLRYKEVETGNGICNMTETWYLTAISSEPTSDKTLSKILTRAMHWFKAHRTNAQVGLSG